jgi:hypothetical protein
MFRALPDKTLTMKNDKCFGRYPRKKCTLCGLQSSGGSLAKCAICCFSPCLCHAYNSPCVIERAEIFYRWSPVEKRR